jgi:hypothetical protein
MARYRTYSIEFKRQVVQDDLPPSFGPRGSGGLKTNHSVEPRQLVASC